MNAACARSNVTPSRLNNCSMAGSSATSSRSPSSARLKCRFPTSNATRSPSSRDRGVTASTRSTLALASQARKYGLGLIFATQAPKGLHNHIPGNAATQFYGLLNSPVQIATAEEMARAKGGLISDISRLRAGNFYVATEGKSFHRVTAPWCLSYHPASPPSAEEVLALAQA